MCAKSAEMGVRGFMGAACVLERSSRTLTTLAANVFLWLKRKLHACQLRTFITDAEEAQQSQSLCFQIVSKQLFDEQI